MLIIKGYIALEKLELEVYEKLKQIGINKGNYPINPYNLIIKENIILNEMPFDNQNIRGMIAYGPNCTGIVINSNRSYVSRRFIAMHELSHYWFHPHETRKLCLEHYNEEHKSVEWQANNAAAFALMPTDIVLEVYNYYCGDIYCMASFFKVSLDTMIYRIKTLKLPLKKVYTERTEL